MMRAAIIAMVLIGFIVACGPSTATPTQVAELALDTIGFAFLSFEPCDELLREYETVKSLLGEEAALEDMAVTYTVYMTGNHPDEVATPVTVEDVQVRLEECRG